MKQPFFPGQPPDCEILVRKGGLVCRVAFWPICDSIPLCAKAGKEYAKRTKLYLQWNEVFGGNVEVPVLDFSWGGRRKLMFLLIKIDHGCIGIMSPIPRLFGAAATIHDEDAYLANPTAANETKFIADDLGFDLGCVLTGIGTALEH